jgi:SAM-dependent MidA family methyltransferase
MPTPRDLSSLPPPTPEEAAVAARMTEHLRAAIGTGSIPFSRFMELALYAPGLGYYTGGRRKFGEQGDYITAPELTPLYGRCLARTARDVLAALGDADILEFGAGSGKLAAGMLTELASLGKLPNRYLIVDLSPDLRQRQIETFASLAPELRARIQWLDRLPNDFRGLVLGNEVLDAMPVERFRITADGAKRLHVGWRDDAGFVWLEGELDPDLTARLEDYRLPVGYTSEVGWVAEAWVRSVADSLSAGVALLIDYGFPRAEFYHPDRSQGTLMCHYRHRSHADPLILPGLQDITAHIDFTAIAESANAGGLEVLGYTGQGAFLLASGLPELVAQADSTDARTYLTMTEQVKKLTLPHEMGELFKVMALGRGAVPRLAGFALQDRRGRL